MLKLRGIYRCLEDSEPTAAIFESYPCDDHVLCVWLVGSLRPSVSTPLIPNAAADLTLIYRYLTLRR